MCKLRPCSRERPPKPDQQMRQGCNCWCCSTRVAISTCSPFSSRAFLS